MEDGEALSSAETQALREGIAPPSEAPGEPSARPGIRLGRWVAVLCAGTAVAAVAGAAWRHGVEIDPEGNFPPGLETTGSLGSVVELTTAHEFAQMLDAVNTERQKQGLPDVCYNEKLNAAAKAHSEDMARHRRMSHTGSDGSSPFQRMKRASYNYRMAAENVAAGQTSVPQVMKSWMNSPGHRSNILHNGISHFGFAMKDNYWTQVFGSPLGDEGCMLAGGGEDGSGGRCRDIVPKGQTRWHDSDGAGYHCDWYAEGDRCTKHGSKYENFGYVAKKACCACGGGGGAGCRDKVPEGMSEWHDNDGKQYHCDWYAEETDRCANYGKGHANGGLTASQACCTCGGGSSAADPTPKPARPTRAPAGACCGEPCQSHSDCAGSEFFC